MKGPQGSGRRRGITFSAQPECHLWEGVGKGVHGDEKALSWGEAGGGMAAGE